MSDIKLTIKQRKWRWLGHTLRKGQDDITNQSLKWNPQGNGKVGRPKSTKSPLKPQSQQLLLPKKNEKA